MKKVLIMELKPGDVQTTAPIPLTVKANEPLRKNAHIKYPAQGYLRKLMEFCSDTGYHGADTNDKEADSNAHDNSSDTLPGHSIFMLICCFITAYIFTKM